MSTNNYLQMSDEEFLNTTPPEPEVVVTEEPGETPASAVVAVEEAVPGSETPAAVTVAEEAIKEPVVADADVPPVEPVAVPGAPDKTDLNPILSAADDKVVKPEPATKVVPEAKVEPAKTAEKAPEPKVEAPTETAAPVNYEEFFKQVMTPFKANGKMVEPKTAEEAIRLMQMGAGFGRKIQDMQPHLKAMRMLEKNNLLDPDKLSFLIEVQNKNPDAIKKIIAESGIDPLDINTEDNINYKPVNHAVSDEEVAFNEALAEVNLQPTGGVTLEHINQTWDAQSKAVLWESPQLLGVIQSQRETGIYDRITAEIDRQKTFGLIPQNASFLQAYKIAGDALVAANAFQAPSEDPAKPVSTVAAAPVAPVVPQVIATRTEAPKPVVVNSDKANAASPSPTTARKAATFQNPLEMADEVFLKQFEGRL